MLYRIAIEITHQAGNLPEELIIKGYRYSQFGPVAFILNGVTPAEINKALDPVVPMLPLDIPGVKYIDLKAKAVVCETIIASKSIIAVSLAFTDAIEKASRFFDYMTPRVIQRPSYLPRSPFEHDEFPSHAAFRSSQLQQAARWGS